MVVWSCFHICCLKTSEMTIDAYLVSYWGSQYASDEGYFMFQSQRVKKLSPIEFRIIPKFYVKWSVFHIFELQNFAIKCLFILMVFLVFSRRFFCMVIYVSGLKGWKVTANCRQKSAQIAIIFYLLKIRKIANQKNGTVIFSERLVSRFSWPIARCLQWRFLWKFFLCRVF